MDIEKIRKLKKEMRNMNYDKKIEYLLKYGRREAYQDVLCFLGNDRRTNRKLRKYIQERM
jgi:hypothetical protein